MNRFSIPAFVEELTPDTSNAKYSRGKLKTYYIGETSDKRVFTKEFSDKLLSTIAYTPVVGFYSVADEDFIGHNVNQNIYGIVPADTAITYIEDAEKNVTFVTVDVLLYTGRPDDTGAIASKIIGKQHSLELDPASVKYKINRDEAGNFKNLEFTDGELIGLSVLGDNDTPAFSGSEFFSANELPDIITEENINKYQALFNYLTRIEPTAEEVEAEIYRTMRAQNIYGYICEHKPEQYVVISSDYDLYNRYSMNRNEEGILVLNLECPVRHRFLSDDELESLANVKKGSSENFDDSQTQNNPLDGAKTNEGGATAFDTNTSNEENRQQELEDLRVNCSNLENTITDLNNSIESLSTSLECAHTEFDNLQNACKNYLIQCYSRLLDSTIINNIDITQCSVEELNQILAEEYQKIQAETHDTIFEILNIDNTPPTYNEKDEAAVVEKYKNMNRGKN